MLPILTENELKEKNIPQWLPKWMASKIERVEKAGYRVVGTHKHSAIKVCHYTKEDLRGKNTCYKCKFYGIGSSRCLQMTPVMFWCDFNCKFCWRNLGYTLPPENYHWDSPDEIMNSSIKSQQDLLQGFAGSDRVDKEKFRKALEPKHVAISLSGEPTLYPMLPELIDNIIKKRNMTAYLVTNGQHPEMIKKLLNHQPTNFYISLYGPDEETYKKTCDPMVQNPFKKVKESLALMKNFECRTVIRFTMTQGLNFHSPEKFSKLIEFAQPDCVEVKAFMAVGGSRARLKYEDMPFHEQIRKFAQVVEKNSNYKILDEKKDSRVVLLTKKNIDINPQEIISDDAYKMYDLQH